MAKHTQTIRRQQPTNCLNVFDLFVRLALTQWIEDIFKTSSNFKLSCPDKTYMRCLQYNLTATNCKRAQKRLGKTSIRRLRYLPKTSHRHLLKMSSRRILSNFKNKTFYFHLFISCFLIFGQNVVTTLSFQRCCAKKSNVFTTCLRRRICDQVSTLQQ